jgi:predicted nucleic acid-binding protein
MSSLNFLDANVWLALCVSRHVHSEQARSWFEKAEQENFSSVDLHSLQF